MEKPVQEQPASEPKQVTPKGYEIPVAKKIRLMEFFRR